MTGRYDLVARWWTTSKKAWSEKLLDVDASWEAVTRWLVVMGFIIAEALVRDSHVADETKTRGEGGDEELLNVDVS